MYTQEPLLVQDYHKFEAYLHAVAEPLTVEYGEQTEVFLGDKSRDLFVPLMIGLSLLGFAAVCTIAFVVYSRRRAIWAWILDDENFDLELPAIASDYKPVTVNLDGSGSDEDGQSDEYDEHTD